MITIPVDMPTQTGEVSQGLFLDEELRQPVAAEREGELDFFRN